MFYTIPCFVTGTTIELNSQIFLLGELTEDILNISREEFLEFDTIRDKLEEFRFEDFEARVEMQALRKKL